jgi:hypothetical protein
MSAQTMPELRPAVVWSFCCTRTPRPLSTLLTSLPVMVTLVVPVPAAALMPWFTLMPVKLTDSEIVLPVIASVTGTRPSFCTRIGKPTVDAEPVTPAVPIVLF